MDILTNGIRLERGKKYMSFSNGAGFYLTNEYKEAESWTFKHHPAEDDFAILAFEVKDPRLVFDGRQGLEWTVPSLYWGQAVKFFRSGENKIKAGITEDE